MVKVQGPAFSFDASGKLGGALVYSKWKGRNYIRSLVKPANPRSAGQTGMRTMFSFLSRNWQNLTSADQATWEDAAAAEVVSPFNAFMQANQKLWRNFLYPSKQDPIGNTGTVATVHVLTATGGIRQASIGFSCTTIEDNWGIMIFRDLETAFTPAWSNAVRCELYEAVEGGTWIDTPLVPDTYYYRSYLFTNDGVYNDEDDEVNAVVT